MSLRSPGGPSSRIVDAIWPAQGPCRAGNRGSGLEGERPVRRWLQRNAESAYLFIVGLLLLLACWGAVAKGDGAASATLALLGGGALVVAPFATRLQGTLKIGAVEMTLRQRVVGIAARASVETLEGVLPLIEGQDVVVRLVRLPAGLAGHALTDPELGFIRKELQLRVVAVR